MADQFIQVPVDSTGKKVDVEELTVGANTVERQRVQLSGSAAAELAKLKNTGPVAADYGLVTRNIPRREGAVLSTAALGISGVYTQAWQDGNADGSLIVQAVARADQASAANGFVIEETDDDTDVNFVRVVAQKSVTANTTTFLYAVIRGRKWRVKYTNGAVAQTSFKITATSSVHAAFPADVDGQIFADIIDKDARLLGRVKLLSSGGAMIDPAVDRTAAAAPFAIRLSDGAAFYDAAKSGQLPAALVGGRLDVNLGASGAGVTIEVIGDVAHDIPAAAVNPALVGGFASAAAPADVSLDNDAVRAWFLRNGAQAIVLTAAGALIGGDATNGLDVDVTRVQGNVTVVGPAAHDAPVSGNPLRIAGKANLNEPVAVADGDVADLWVDQLGRVVTVDGHANPEPPVTINATVIGNTTVIAAPGVSLSLYIQKASIHNRAATNRLVALQDGAGGTNRWRAELAAEGGGSLIDFGARGWKLTANTLLNVNLDAAGDIDVNITEYYIAA